MVVSLALTLFLGFVPARPPSLVCVQVVSLSPMCRWFSTLCVQVLRWGSPPFLWLWLCAKIQVNKYLNDCLLTFLWRTYFSVAPGSHRMISIGETRSTSYSCVFHGSLSGPHLLELRKTLGERYGLNYTKLLYKCLGLSRMPKHRNKGQRMC